MVSKITAKQQYVRDLELIKSTPKNRTEAKAHLAAKLRIEKYKPRLSRSEHVHSKVGAAGARMQLDKSNALRFGEGLVEPVVTERISDVNKKWRGRTAD